MDLFARPEGENYYEFVSRINKYINANNIFNVSRKTVKSLMAIGQETNYLKYRFDLVRNWVKYNFRYTVDCINKLQKILRNLWLDNVLNNSEIQFIYDAQNIVFAQTRNLKATLVDLKVKKREYVYYFYNLLSFQVDKKIYENLQINITNKRVVINASDSSYEFQLTDIQEYHLFNTHLFIKADSKTYRFYSDAPAVLYVSLQRVLKLMRININ